MAGVSVKTNFKAHSGSVEVSQSEPRVAINVEEFHGMTISVKD